MAAHAYIRGHHGKRHLPTVLRLVTEAISKLSSTSTNNSSKNRNKFRGIHPQKRERGLHPATEERFWCGLEVVQEITERPGQLGLQVRTIFRQY
jgi:hypothetical protein